MKKGADDKRNNSRLFRRRSYSGGLYSFAVWAAMAFAALFFVLIAILDSGVSSGGVYTPEKVFVLSDDWKYISENGKRISLSLPRKLEREPGDTVTVSRILPAKLRDNPAVGFYSEYQGVTVALDDEIIYEQLSGGGVGKAAPSGWSFIGIPHDAGGGVLSLTFSSAYSRYSVKLPEILYGEKTSLILSCLSANLPGLIAAIILMITGVTLLVATVLLLRSNEQYTGLKFLSVFTSLTAFWVLSNSRFPYMSFIDDSAVMFIGNLSIILCPLPFLIFLKSRFDRKYHTVLNVIFWIFAANFTAALLLQISGTLDFEETMIFTRVLVAVAVAVCVVIYFFNIKRKKIQHTAAELSGGAVFLMSVIWSTVRAMLPGASDSGMVLSLGIFVYIICLFTSSVLDIFDVSRQSIELDRELQQSKLQLMISQIQPHFIFNSLGAVQAMIRSNPETAYALSMDFSKYLRANISALNSTSLISFDKELEHIETYLRIEKVRYGDRLRVKYEIDTAEFSLPQLSIQPLVENAVKGVFKKVDGGTVTIRSREERDFYVVEVEDDGVGFEVKLLDVMGKESGSTGLKNITYRLREIVNAQVTIDSMPDEGTKVTVQIPKEREKEGEERERLKSEEARQRKLVRRRLLQRKIGRRKAERERRGRESDTDS